MGSASIEELLNLALSEGAFRIGQVHSERMTGGGSELRHFRDARAAPAELTAYRDPEDAAELARYDDAGLYRPLKSAPNLRRGWRLSLPDVGALRLAIDLIYPARLGAFMAFQAGRLDVTHLRETLGRQSGLYRVTQKLTNEEADALVGRFCRSDGGCLRTILWKLDDAGAIATSQLPSSKFDPLEDQSAASEGAAAYKAAPWIPLLCQEACNLLVADARRVIKSR